METNNGQDESAGSLDATKPAAGPALQTADQKDAGGQLEGVAPEQQPVSSGKQKKPNIFKRVNIYLLLFVLLLIIAVTIAVIFALNTKGKGATTVTTQSLSTDTLKQLANSDTSVGDPKQVLSVQSNAIFAGNVLIRQAAEIAGNLTIGGTLKLAAITVNGNGTFDQVQANSMSVSGNAGVQGQLSVQKSLSAASGSFSGPVSAPTVNTSNLQLTGDFSTTKHIVVGGASPSKSDGSALGSGGTSTVSGADTAGTVVINTGSNTAAGCFINITFTTRFASTPRVIVTPVGSAAGATAFYVNRTVTGFSICTAEPAAAGANLGFDYFVVG